ncbi:unnamed protein product [Chrysoparadoxa australica]
MEDIITSCPGTNVPIAYETQDSFFGGEAPLSLGVGYAVVFCFGIAFSFFTTLLVWMDRKYNNTLITSEHFNTAGRSVKTGLTASVIVSQWTWAATLLQSSNVAWQYGVSGPFWYAAGASIQVLLFGILAIEVKRKAPTCHTFLEIIDARWGPTCHKLFLWFALLTNVIVTSMLLLGGAATVNALTGMNLNLASFLIPWGVIAYTMAGGLKATFLASYIHTAIIFVALLIFVFTIYTGPEKFIGSAEAMHEKLEFTSSSEDCLYGPSCSEYTLTACGGVVDNKEGSYLTMLSLEGFVFGIINIIGNFGTVFVDQSYWQSAIAAKPSSSHKGYLLGGLCWFTIPFALATSLGLAAVAMNLPLTAGEAGSGLVPPATALHVLGNGGAVLILIMLFMAVTSTGSAELIAVSSLISYDVYRRYIKPDASGDDILRVSRFFIFGFGALMGVFAIALNEIGLNLGWVYLFMGVVIGSAVIPVAMCLTWAKCTAKGAMAGALLGQVAALITWIATAAGLEGEVTVATLGGNYPMLAGNVVAIGFSGIVATVVSLSNPDNYTWDTTKQIAMVEQDDTAWMKESDYDEVKLSAAKNWIMKWGLGFTLVLIIAWPILSIAVGVFTVAYFKFWVAVSAIWGLWATFMIVFLPLLESRDDILHVCYGLVGAEMPVPASAKIAALQERVARLEAAAGYDLPPKVLDDEEEPNAEAKSAKV